MTARFRPLQVGDGKVLQMFALDSDKLLDEGRTALVAGPHARRLTQSRARRLAHRHRPSPRGVGRRSRHGRRSRRLDCLSADTPPRSLYSCTIKKDAATGALSDDCKLACK
jgi:hypothetical protein